MAGSLNHIVAEDGTFTMALIENMGDAHEALAECHQIIAELILRTRGLGFAASALLEDVCRDLGFPEPKAVPVIEPALHGAESAYRDQL